MSDGHEEQRKSSIASAGGYRLQVNEPMREQNMRHRQPAKTHLARKTNHD
jgi:hypothetical protein